MADICVFYQYFSTPAGAWGTRWFELAKRWAAAGHRVTVVTSVYDKSDLDVAGLWDEQDIDGIRVIAINTRLSNRHGFFRRIISFGLYAGLSCWFALRLRYDVAISSSGPLSVGLPGLLAKWVRRRPLVFEVRDLWPAVPIELGVLQNPIAIRLARVFERLCYRSSSIVVALSPGMVSFIEASGGKSIAVIPNAADLDLFGPAATVTPAMTELTRERFVAVYAGTLGKANSGDELVAIAEALKVRSAAQILILVIGDGIELGALKARAVTLGLDNIRFLGKRPKQEVAGWLKCASAVLIGLKPFPILQTSSPNKLFDGLASGRLVLNNTEGWIGGILADADAGFTYPPGDALAAATILTKLSQDPDRVAQMGRNARTVAEQSFAREVLATRYLEIIASLASGSSLPPDIGQHTGAESGKEAA